MTGQTAAADAPVDDRRTPYERLAMLCDSGEFVPLLDGGNGGRVGVVAATGRVNGSQVVCYALDGRVAGGAVGTREADVMVTALQLAHRERWPVVAFLESAGARLQDGAAALGGFGRIFYGNVALRGRAPQISVITGASAGGGCYSPALTDFTVMTRSAAMFLTGPKVVREAVGEQISADALGGPRVHERNGVCHLVADDDRHAAALTRELIGFLDPGAPPRSSRPQSAPLDPGRHVPAETRVVYDIRDVIRDIVDDARLLELAPRWARNIVVGFARLGGHRIGVIANQPRHLGGVLDVGASEKGARFVNTCQTFGVPLLVLVDTPGFLPGSSQESAGVIRHGAELVRAFAAATVPRFTVVLRKAYGGAYITMNSKELGADLVLAWAGSEIGIMAPEAAVMILHRRELAAVPDPDERARQLAAEYAARHIAAERARDHDLVDAVIEPAETRARLLDAAAAFRRPPARRRFGGSGQSGAGSDRPIGRPARPFAGRP